MASFKVEDYIQKPKFLNVKMFNASLEDYDKQFDSKPIKFPKNDYVEVPANLVEHIYESMKDFGVFPIFDVMTKEDIKEAHRDALLKYLKGKIEQTIQCYQADLDNAKRNGITREMYPRHKRLLRWKSEIYTMLNEQRPIEEELSFTADVVKDFENNVNIFSPEAFATATIETPEMMRERAEAKRGRKTKSSFENIDLGDIG